MDFIRELSDVKVTQLPTNVTFECEVSKPHLPSQWFKDDAPIRRGDRLAMETESRIHRLIIKDVEGVDEADYSVLVKNSSSKANLSICGKL